MMIFQGFTELHDGKKTGEELRLISARVILLTQIFIIMQIHYNPVICKCQIVFI
jgi:hypothetical protein